MIRLALVLAVAAMLGALAIASAAAGTATTIVRGAVLRGPVTPVCVEDVPCSAPFPRVTIVFSRRGVDVARATTNERGRFVVRLAPGAYGIRLLGGGRFARPTPRAVRVPVAKAIWLRLDVDTGIRTPGPVVAG